jgi:hypothetical protein
VLFVYSGKLPDGRQFQTMDAKEKAEVQLDGYLGNSDVIKFDEREQKVIFEGSTDHPAKLFQMSSTPGRPPKEAATGKRIEYNRLTGSPKVDGGQNINIGQ